MNLHAALYHAELEEALSCAEPILPILDDIAVGLATTEPDARAAQTLKDSFIAAQRLADLCQWVVSRIDCLDCQGSAPAVTALAASQRHICLLHVIFDSTALLANDCSESQKNQMIASLEKVWQHHLQWREYAGQVAISNNFSAWLDPATTAENSLFALVNKPPQALIQQLQALDSLGESYPTPLRDHCYYLYLRYLARCCQPDTVDIGIASFPRYAGLAFARVVAGWSKRNPFLLELACREMLVCAAKGWSTLAPQLFTHARDRLSLDEQEELCEILGEEAKPMVASIEELSHPALSWKGINPVPLTGLWPTTRHCGE